jgi:hypothetical protein
VALTPNLKLRTDSSLTVDARYNLLRIDSLGALLKAENTGTVLIRSIADIVLRPNSEDLGGTGTGGIVSVGDADGPVDLVDIHANTIDFNSASVIGLVLDELITDSWVAPAAGINVSKLGAGTVSNTEFGYLVGLTSNVQQQIDSIAGSNQLAANWLPGDGAIKTVTHNFGTFNLLCQVLDSGNNYERIQVAEVIGTDSNTVQLTSTEAPSSTWVVLLTQVA